MEYVDDNILSNILTHLNYEDLRNTKAVNKQFRSMSKEIYPNLQQFFDLINNRSQQPDEKTCEKESTILFPYSKSLTYSEIEYWARVGIRLYNQKQNKGLLNAITYKLSKINHEKSDFTNQLTSEQQRVINCQPRNNRNIIVQAFAGTGKTTTLYEYAKKWNTKRILYLTYNRSLAEESKLKFANCDHVQAMTIHSLAYSYFMNSTQDYMEIGNVTVEDIYKYFKDHNKLPEDEDDQKLLRKCKTILEKFNKYVNSDHPNSEDSDVELIWDLMFTQNKLKITHDAYLKRYQLKQVTLDYDVILLDEVQDCTDCVLNIVLSQPCARLFVGDRYQTIYSFKYVNDPFSYILNSNDRNSVFKLSVSFRMGFDLMYFTNIFLKKKFGENEGFSRCKRPNTHIKNDNCHGNSKFSFHNFPKGTVILCRYNISMQKCIFDLAFNGYTFDCYGKTINCAKEIEIVNDFISLKNNDLSNVKHNKIKSFDSYDSMVNHFQVSNNNKWKDRINLFAHHGESLLDLWTLSSKQFKQESDFVVTTAHQAKGAEFDNVVMYNDFQIHNTDSINVCYVAMTRAKNTLYVNKLLTDFFEKHKCRVYYDDCKFSKFYKKCHVCKTIQTNSMILTEIDPGAIFYNECDLFSYNHTCRGCMRTLF